MWKKIALLAILASVKCNPVQENGVAENLVGAVKECIETDTSLCLKVNIVDTKCCAVSVKRINVFSPSTDDAL